MAPIFTIVVVCGHPPKIRVQGRVPLRKVQKLLLLLCHCGQIVDLREVNKVEGKVGLCVFYSLIPRILYILTRDPTSASLLCAPSTD